MHIREFTKPVTAKQLNESLAEKFGKRLNLGKFTLEQLVDARNKLRTQISQVEMTEGFSEVIENENYQRSKLMLDVLNSEIDERGDVDSVNLEETTVTEGAEDQAEIVMAAKDMVDRVTNWMEDTAEMQTESMLELADAIRDEMGSEQAERYVQTVKPSLEAMYTAMEATRGSLTQSVGLLTGEGEAPAEPMGADMGAEEMPMEPTVDQEAEAEGDDFGGDQAAAGGTEPAGRPARESVEKTLTSKKK